MEGRKGLLHVQCSGLGEGSVGRGAQIPGRRPTGAFHTALCVPAGAGEGACPAPTKCVCMWCPALAPQTALLQPPGS